MFLANNLLKVTFLYIMCDILLYLRLFCFTFLFFLYVVTIFLLILQPLRDLLERNKVHCRVFSYYRDLGKRYLEW